MLRTATPKDFAFIHSIAARPENGRFIMDMPDQQMGAHLDDPEMDLVIWEHAGAPAGYALFCEIGNRSGRVELRSLGLDVSDSGLGQPFLRALIDHAFDNLDRHRIWLDVALDNPRAQAAYHRAGFTHEGTLRQNWKRPIGDIVDMQIFGMLKAERPQ